MIAIAIGGYQNSGKSFIVYGVVGGHIHRIIKAAMYPIILPSFTNPAGTYCENNIYERMDMLKAYIMTCK